MRNLTFTHFKGDMKLPYSWHQKLLGVFVMLCMSVGFMTDANAQINITGTVNNVSCNSIPCPPDADGDIDLTVTGAAAPYVVEWSFNGTPIPDICEEPAFLELDGEGATDLLGVDNNDVENAILTRNYIIQGSALTVNSAIFNGGAEIDEEIINASQEGTIVALRTGVDHPDIIGGPNAANMIRSFTFDPPVSNLNMFFNDLDNNDVVIVNPKLGGVTQTLTPAEYTIIDGTQVALSQVDARGNADPNMFTSLVDQALNATTTGGIDFVFAGPIDEVEIIFYDDVAEPGETGSEGGSYSVNFPGQCREDLACIEAGSYTVTITDANNVTATETFVVQPAVNCTADETVVIPCGEDLATVTVTPTFGVAPYTFGWENEDGTPLPLPNPCTPRDWANFEDLAGTGSTNVENVNTPIVENAINSAPFVIQGAVMTVQEPIFAGGATIDEEVINDSQLDGIFGLRTGVNHPDLVGGVGAANMTRTITFDKPVCDLNMIFGDIDNNDIAIVNPKLNGVTYTMTAGVDFTLPAGAATNVIYQGGNLFDSAVDAGINGTDDGIIDFTFSQCIDEIEIIYYDDVAQPGETGSEGGSYSIAFPETCDYPDTQTLPPGCYDVTVYDANGDSQIITYCIEQGPCGAIGNYVWVDENGDGIQDAGEPGIAGVTVTATNPATGDVLTTTTDANGGYLFDDLPAGKYDILVDATTLPSGMTQTTNPTLQGADFGNQTQAGAGYSITIADGEENMTGDFGYIWENPDGNAGTAAIGDRVWYDANSDGVQDPGEAGIGGVTVTVYYDPDGDGIKDQPFTGAIDQNGNTGTGTTVTEPDGTYIFYNLPAGAYSIVVDPGSAPLSGLTQTGDPDDYGAPATNPDNQGESVILAPGDTYLLMDFGYNDPTANDIGDTIYFDPNANGTQDAGEPGIPGVTVALLDQNGDPIATTTTDANGEYLFPGLPDEPYTVVVTDTDNVLGGLVNSGDPDGGNDDMSSVTGLPADNLDQDFGYTPEGQDPGEGLVGDTVFLDYNSDGTPDPGEGIEGVTVFLHDGTGVTIDSTVTDENGNYYFPGLDPTATYSTTVDPTTLPPGVAQTVDPDGTLDDSSTTDLSQTGGIDLTLDYGYEPSASPGSIGTLVWLDNNTDGVNDGAAGPDGIAGNDDDEPGIEGVTIDLYSDLNGNGTVDPGEPLVASTVTDAAGNYLFPNLPTGKLSGADYIVDVTDENNVLEGYWHSLGTPMTDDNSQTDTYAVTLGAGQPVDNVTADFGYYVEPAVLGNYVWMDTNRDGIQDPGEMPIEGAVVTLEITYPDGSVVTVVDTTDATGHYIFENLLFDEDYDGTGTYATPGVGGGDEPYYNLSVANPPGKTPTVIDVNGNGNDAEDSEDPAGTQGVAQQGFTDSMPQTDPNDEPTHLTFDFGFVGPPDLGAIGNLVWIDENGDGLQDAGEPGIPGVTVTATNPADGTVLTTVTDSDGGYLFDDLPAGKYDVLVDATTLPSGMAQTPLANQGSDFGNQTQAGNGYSITIGDGEENLTGDFGYIWEDPDGNTGTAAIGDRVWYDADSDGVQDPGEAGIGGVTVTVLHDPDGDGIKDTPFTAAIDQNGNTGTGVTTTEPDGSYIFYNLPAGAYAIEVDGASTPLSGLTQTGDPDDYAAPATNPDNRGESVVLAPGDVFLLMDFGYNDPAANDIGDTIYFDPNANGTQDAGEPGIEGVTVSLLDQNGDPIATTTTDENGEYLFPGLPDEPYTVVVTDTDNVLGGLTNSGDPDGGNDDMSSVPNLPADNLDQDFGYTPEGQDPGEGLIGDTVFIDYDQDGAPSPGEGIEGVVVDLHDGNGTVIATTTTDENGNYYFPGLDPTATYSVTVDPTTLPPGVAPTVDPDGGLDNTSTVDLSQDPDGIDLDQDFGYFPSALQGSIGNLVWLDNNVNGVNDGPAGPDGDLTTLDDNEPGIEGVTIDLYRDNNGNGLVDPGEPLVSSTTTDANGNYLFPNLDTGKGAGVDYIVDVTDENNVLEGHWHSLGTPGANDNSQTDTYAVPQLGGGGNPVDNLTADFGYYVEPAKIGNRVWEDLILGANGLPDNTFSLNGIQDSSEVGIPNKEVFLDIAYPDGSTVTLVTTTDADGFYCFGNLLYDENYSASGGPGQPIYTVSVSEDTLTGPSGRLILPSPVSSFGSNTFDDSNEHAGTNAIACQGWTDVTADPDPNNETPWASYDFGFGDKDLPVEMSSFKAAEQDCEVTLTWVTATELNVSHFNIEESTDGINFIATGRVGAAGNSQSDLTYTYVDDQLNEDNYYRLRIVDFDGSYDYSDIVHVAADCAGGVVISDVFPNPVKSHINVLFNSDYDHQTAMIVITDNLGRTVLTETAGVSKGNNVIEVNVEKLPQATYFITIQGENGWFSQTTSFVKIK